MATGILLAVIGVVAFIFVIRSMQRTTALRGAICDAFHAKMIYDKMSPPERLALENEGIQWLIGTGVSPQNAPFMMKERQGVAKFNQLAYVLSKKGITPLPPDQSWALVDRPGLVILSQEDKARACIQQTSAAFAKRYGVAVELKID